MTIELEDLLRDELMSQAQGIHLSPHVFQAAKRRHRRRRAITGAVSGTAVVTAAAVVATTTVGTSGTAHPGRTVAGPQSHRSTAQQPKLETVAYVRQRILEAVDPQHAIVRTAWNDHDQTNDNWFDPDTGYITVYTREHGILTSVTRYPQTKAGTLTSVDYDTRTYSVEHQDAQPLPQRTEGKLGEPMLDTVADIKAAVRRVDVQIVGHGTIDGRPATHLRFTFRSAGDTVIGDAWFDSESYVPLRATTTYDAGPAPAPATQLRGASGAITNEGSRLTDTTWFLPRTADNIAKTQLTIPDGFRRS